MGSVRLLFITLALEESNSAKLYLKWGQPLKRGAEPETRQKFEHLFAFLNHNINCACLTRKCDQFF